MGIVIGVFGVVISFGILIITYYRWVHLPRSETKRIRLLREKEELEEKLSICKDSFGSLERSLKNFVIKNKFQRGFGAYTESLSSDLQERIEKYNEIFDRCVDWETASKDVIALRLQELTQEYLPKTRKERDLIGLLNVDELTQRYLKGEDVTKRWIEKEYPTGLYEDLIENLKDKETKLDLFFRNLNKTFQKNEVLERFRKEKKSLIEFGQTIIKDLKEEEKKLEKELEKYKDIH